MRDDRVYLEHITLQLFVESGKDEFIKSRLIQDAVIRNLEIIGEAVKNLSHKHVLNMKTSRGVKWQAYGMF
jgi:uncharacterized protein with HEPN domain